MNHSARQPLPGMDLALLDSCLTKVVTQGELEPATRAGWRVLRVLPRQVHLVVPVSNNDAGLYRTDNQLRESTAYDFLIGLDDTQAHALLSAELERERQAVREAREQLWQHREIARQHEIDVRKIVRSIGADKMQEILDADATPEAVR